LQAKLLFREGKTNQAGARLEAIARFFPVGRSGTNAPMELKDNLTVSWRNIPAGNQILAELGVFYLARGRYLESLDHFMLAGFWPDAAYVAERVLTVDELKTYVDSHWSVLSDDALDHPNTDPVTEAQPDPRKAIRYLLARRLTRDLRGNEAREYYPAEWQPPFDALVEALTNGWNEALPAGVRAAALFTAAQITRTNGMELIGTELWPDWHVSAGDLITYSAELRTNASLKVVPASRDELRRAQAHRPDPEERFHYRYQAAFLGLEAAKLMPNNSDETAWVLCISGSWLKARDPQTADIFYKTLVRRCRRTVLGEAADRLRWFPRTDDAGNLEPPAAESSSPPEGQSGGDSTTEPGEFPIPGQSYIVHAGDSIAGIAEWVTARGATLTVQDIFRANPGLDASRLMIGQRILIPAPGPAEQGEAPR
jgi:hypothetical protein